MAITKDDIFQAANELDALGQSPTLAAVRKHLGGGSFTTISEAMSEWKSKKTAKEMPLREPVPQGMQDQLSSLGGEIWALAMATANARLESERQSLEDKRVAGEIERQAAVELADQVIAELEELKQKAIEMEAERVTTQQTILNLSKDLAAAMERAVAAETRVVEISHRADDLNAELLRVSTQNSELIKGLTLKLTNSSDENRLPDAPPPASTTDS
jgi:chromosome segregation ATPase